MLCEALAYEASTWQLSQRDTLKIMEALTHKLSMCKIRMMNTPGDYHEPRCGACRLHSG